MNERQILVLDQLLTWRAAIKLETVGLRRSGRRQISTVVREQLGFTGTKKEILKKLDEYIETKRGEAQEQNDLVALRAAIQEEKLNSYSWMASIALMKPDQLMHIGHTGKTNAEVVLWALNYSGEKIRKLIAKHTAKYPD